MQKTFFKIPSNNIFISSSFHSTDSKAKATSMVWPEKCAPSCTLKVVPSDSVYTPSRFCQLSSYNMVQPLSAWGSSPSSVLRLMLGYRVRVKTRRRPPILRLSSETTKPIHISKINSTSFCFNNELILSHNQT